MKKLAIGIVLLVITSGCTVVTQDQKNWVYNKANRSKAYVALMDAGKTTREQDQEWIRLQNEAWQLWAKKMKMGLAAPSFLVDKDKGADK